MCEGPGLSSKNRGTPTTLCIFAILRVRLEFSLRLVSLLVHSRFPIVASAGLSCFLSAHFDIDFQVSAIVLYCVPRLLLQSLGQPLVRDVITGIA